MKPDVSRELGILLKSICSCFIEASEAGSRFVNKTKEVNIDRLMKMARFHKLRPVLLAFDSTANILDPVSRTQLETLRQQQALRNLANIREFHHIYDLLNQEGVTIWPMKGSLFIHAIYGNRQIREFTDVDILCRKQEVKKVVKILINRGYIAVARRSIKIASSEDDILTKMLDWGYHQEITLYKNPAQIDLHWGFFKPYYGYTYPDESIIEKGNYINFFGKEILGPGPEELFWMLMAHHAGIEQWKTLRHLADLICFMNTYGEDLDFQHLLRQARSTGMYTVILDGFWLLQTLFDYPLPSNVKDCLSGHRHRSYHQIIEQWELSNRSTVQEKFLQQKIWLKSQDETFGYFRYIFKRLAFYYYNKNLHL